MNAKPPVLPWRKYHASVEWTSNLTISATRENSRVISPFSYIGEGSSSASVPEVSGDEVSDEVVSVAEVSDSEGRVSVPTSIIPKVPVSEEPGGGET